MGIEIELMIAAADIASSTVSSRIASSTRGNQLNLFACFRVELVA